MVMLRDKMTEYVYKITDVTGCFKSQAEVGQNIIDKKYLGLNYTWKCADLKTGNIKGTITGKYHSKKG
jgi:hypothetical protein